MKTLKVYRVENSDGYGPYRQFWQCKYDEVTYDSMKLNEAHFGCSKHPTVLADKIQNFSCNYYCGFASIDSLKNWFDEKWRNILNEAKFKVSIYEVASNNIKRAKSSKQIVFKKVCSKIVKEFSLLNI
jgi:hypothetical protein